MRIGLIIYGDLGMMTGGFLYDRKLVEYLQEQGDTVEVISLPWFNYGPSLLFNASFSLLRRLKKCSFELILEDELVHPSFFILNKQIGRAIRCPIIAVVHHLRSLEERPAWQNRLYRCIENKYLSSIDGFIFNSRATGDTVFPRIAKSPPWVIAYPGGDRFGFTITEEEIAQRTRRSGPIELLFVGSLIPRKGLHRLISALSTLDPQEWHLNVAGNQNRDYLYSKKILKQITDSGLTDRVSILGEIGDPDLAALFRRSQVLVVPSSLEGFGICYLEGMGFGLPAVASKAGGTMEVVSHGENGFLVASGEVNPLASFIHELAQNRDRLLEMSLAARRTFLARPTWTDTGKVIHDFLHHPGRAKK